MNFKSFGVMKIPAKERFSSGIQLFLVLLRLRTMPTPKKMGRSWLEGVLESEKWAHIILLLTFSRYGDRAVVFEVIFHLSSVKEMLSLFFDLLYTKLPGER